MHVFMMVVYLFFVQTAGVNNAPERHLLDMSSMEECNTKVGAVLAEAVKIKNVVAVGISCSDTTVNRIV